MRAVPVFLSTLVLIGSVTPAARAEEPVIAAQKVIESQIRAFLDGDADAAFSYAAPGIKARFGDNKDLFFEMVRQRYEPVYHPGNYAFGRNKQYGDGSMIVQELVITGRDGKNWKALYQMLKQLDGSYRIGGVVIVPDRVSKAI